MRLVVVVAVTGLVLMGCGGESGVGTWRDESGRTLSADPGDDHCDWESVTFLFTPVDLHGGSSGKARLQFVRDPEGKLDPSALVGEYDGDAVLPEDAVDTGFRLDELELWAAPTDGEAGPDAVFVVDGDSVERWPRDQAGIACA